MKLHEDKLKKIESIDIWIDSAPDHSDFANNDEFMKFAVEMMNRCLWLLKIGVALAPNEEVSQKGYTKHRAIIVGHMVRVTKLYEGILIHICNRQLELALVFFRPALEATIRLEYILQSKSKPQSLRSFILGSYKPEREMLQDLASVSQKRPLAPIEKRMKKSIASSLSQDHITQKELFSNGRWNIDGKDFRSIMRYLNYDVVYSYGFGSGSHYVHGDWHDIRNHHIDRQGRYYFPKLKYSDPDPRIACSTSYICLNALRQYLHWNRSDPEKVLLPVIEKMIDLNRRLDSAHEHTLEN